MHEAFRKKIADQRARAYAFTQASVNNPDDPTFAAAAKAVNECADELVELESLMHEAAREFVAQWGAELAELERRQSSAYIGDANAAEERRLMRCIDELESLLAKGAVVVGETQWYILSIGTKWMIADNAEGKLPCSFLSRDGRRGNLDGALADWEWPTESTARSFLAEQAKVSE